MIRYIKPDEMHITESVARAFFKESGIAGTLNFPHFCEQWSKLIELDVASILMYFNSSDQPMGIIGGLCTECTMTKDMTAQEVFWWVDPSLRGRTCAIHLLREWERWARDRGAKRIYVGNLYRLNNDAMMSIYNRIGYQPAELHYVKLCDSQSTQP